MSKSLLELEELKFRWLASNQSFELLAPGFEEYWEGLVRFKEIHSVPKWSEFVSGIRGSVVFAKAYSAATTDSSANVAFTLIVATLNAAEPNEADLDFALTNIDKIFDDSDRAFIKQKLKENRVNLPSWSALKRSASTSTTYQVKNSLL